MMQIRCQRCGWNFTLSRDAIGLAVAELEQSHSEFYQFDCPKCRHVVKVQAEALRRRLPAGYVLPAVPPKPEPVSVSKDGPRPQPLPAAIEEAKSKPESLPAATEEPKPAATKQKRRPAARSAEKNEPATPAAPGGAHRKTTRGSEDGRKSTTRSKRSA